MRLKHSPIDFQVHEILDFDEDPDGEFYVHLLRKEKMDTQEALGLICRELRVPREDIAFAGLKDRQGITEQFISVRGRQLDLRERDLQLRCVGRSQTAISSKQSRGNRFRIVVRALSLDVARTVQERAGGIAASGYVNYFDDQRFGSLRHGQGMPMRDLLAGRFEKALQRMIARPSPVAQGGDTRLKTLLRDKWGYWEECLRFVRGPVYTPVIQHLLRRPDDFAGAIQKLNTRSRLIHAFAYQSYLWNRAVSSFLEERVPKTAQAQIETLMGPLCGLHGLDPELAGELQAVETPLYAPDGDPGEPRFAEQMRSWLKAEQLSEELVRQNMLPGMVWKSEPRELLVLPTNLYANQPEEDDRHRDAYKIELAFNLPRGAYATMLIKHLFAGLGVQQSFAGTGPGGRPSKRPPMRPRYSDRDRDRRGPRRGGRPRGYESHD